MLAPEPQLDLDFVRPQFPALRSGWALFDNAGGSVLPASVISAVTEYMQNYQVQLGASYGLSRQAQAAIDAGICSLSILLGVDAQRLLIGPSSTMNVYLLAQALSADWSPNDEIIISDLDHEANRGAWSRLAERGIVVRSWPINPETAALELAELEPLLNERTRLVCFTHCANMVGAINDVKSITRAVHSVGARVCVDGVAYAPHRALEIDEWDVDIYLTSLYKVFAPHLGVAILKPDLAAEAQSQNHSFIGQDAFPYKLQPGNINHELVASLTGTGQYFASLADHHFGESYSHASVRKVYGLCAQHEARLVGSLLDFLASHRRTRIIGPQDSAIDKRVATVTFTITDVSGRPRAPQAVVEAVDLQGVAIRHGDFYAPKAIESLGLAEQGGLVRASMVHYNSPAEVERLIKALDSVL